MVEMVQQGVAVREVARRCRVAPATVHLWVHRSAGSPLDRVEWADRPSAPHHVHNRTTPEVEQRVLACRRELAAPDNPLGFIGPQAIFEALQAQGIGAPHLRTIARILRRHGILDQVARRRFPPPPPGWYLPDVAQGVADLDAFDIIEGLILEGEGEIEVLTGVALWAPEVNAWPAPAVPAPLVVEHLLARWRRVGLPPYAQFDNDTRFQGGHNHPDVIGRVARVCLSLGVTPVFTPPREPGFQGPLERFNGLWQAKVWHRLHHDSFLVLCARSDRFVGAYTARRATRRDATAPRRPFPLDWRLDLQRPPHGRLLYLRRTDDQGVVSLLGRRFPITPLWSHRLVRCVVDLDHHCIQVFRLRRRDPKDQPLLTTLEYRLPHRRFRE